MSRFCFPELHQFVDKLLHPVGIVLDDVDISFCITVEVCLFQQVLCRAVYQCQRSEKLVCHIREEVQLRFMDTLLILFLDMFQ